MPLPKKLKQLRPRTTPVQTHLPPEPPGRTGKVVHWTLSERLALNAAQARGDRTAVVDMMREKQRDDK